MEHHQFAVGRRHVLRLEIGQARPTLPQVREATELDFRQAARLHG